MSERPFHPRKGETPADVLDGLSPEVRESTIAWWLLKRRSDARDVERFQVQQQKKKEKQRGTQTT